MKRTIGLNAPCFKNDALGQGENTYACIQKMAEFGFEHFFICELNYKQLTVNELPDFFGKCRDVAEKAKIKLDFIHAPFRGINDMWLEGEGYADIYNGMKLTVDMAESIAVPMVIFHLSSGWEPPATNELGFSRFDALVDYADSKGVTIAFENLRNVENVSQMMERYKNRENVKYCYDCGHEHAYTPDTDWIKIFGNKLACVHIHDNLGYDRNADPDAHYLPFDGTFDYADMVRRLDEVGYEGPIMLEVFNTTKPEYRKLTCDEFIAECATRARKIANMGE